MAGAESEPSGPTWDVLEEEVTVTSPIRSGCSVGPLNIETAVLQIRSMGGPLGIPLVHHLAIEEVHRTLGHGRVTRIVYGRAFLDPDGHIREVSHMDMSQVPTEGGEHGDV